MLLVVPPFVHVDPSFVEWIGCLDEIQAANRLAGKLDNIRVGRKKLLPVTGVEDQAAGDDQHRLRLRRCVLTEVTSRGRSDTAGPVPAIARPEGRFRSDRA